MSELSVKGLTYAFPRFTALKNVDLTISSGEVVGILGENGAGKSTLLNVLSGTLQPTAGDVRIDGMPLDVRNYHEANLKGVWRIFQDPAFIPSLRVYENLFLGHEKHFVRFGLLDKGAMIRLATALLADMQLDVDVRAPMFKYDFATRQAMEVGKATLLPSVLGLSAGYVLFDEPTTGLTRSEVTRLLQRMKQLKTAGSGVAFVSHRLQEVFDICDRIVVLKDGEVVGSGETRHFDEDRLHRLMVGRDLGSSTLLRDKTKARGAQQIGVKGLYRQSTSSTSSNRRAEISDINFDVGVGEIVGIGGLMGSGKNQLLRILAGDLNADRGTVEIAGRELTGNIEHRKQLGVAFVSGDRAHESVIGTEGVSANISLPSGHSGPLGFSNRLGLWRPFFERRTADSMIRSLSIKATADQRVSALSGGNQQKVALARWIHRNPKLMLIENPTAGVDVGAKVEIYRLLAQLADRGTSILYVTDDLPELIALSDRILIMRDGSLVADIDNRENTPGEHELVAHMIGRAQAHVA